MKRLLAAFAATAVPLLAQSGFSAPVRLEAGGAPIDTQIGHAAPFVHDFDGDGTRDLVVGQFGGGVLWQFRNTGTNEQPVFAAGTKFKDGKPDGVVPTG